MELTGTIKQGFIPFTDNKEHSLQPCQRCHSQVKGTLVNGPAVADNNGITGAFFLNLWLCRPCYDKLEAKDGQVLFN